MEFKSGISFINMEDIQDPKKLRELEYATQYFGFSPDAYIDNLTSDAKDNVVEILKVKKFNIRNGHFL